MFLLEIIRVGYRCGLPRIPSRLDYGLSFRSKHKLSRRTVLSIISELLQLEFIDLSHCSNVTKLISKHSISSVENTISVLFTFVMFLLEKWMDPLTFPFVNMHAPFEIWNRNVRQTCSRANNIIRMLRI